RTGTPAALPTVTAHCSAIRLWSEPSTPTTNSFIRLPPQRGRVLEPHAGDSKWGSGRYADSTTSGCLRASRGWARSSSTARSPSADEPRVRPAPVGTAGPRHCLVPCRHADCRRSRRVAPGRRDRPRHPGHRARPAARRPAAGWSDHDRPRPAHGVTAPRRRGWFRRLRRGRPVPESGPDLGARARAWGPGERNVRSHDADVVPESSGEPQPRTSGPDEVTITATPVPERRATRVAWQVHDPGAGETPTAFDVSVGLGGYWLHLGERPRPHVHLPGAHFGHSIEVELGLRVTARVGDVEVHRIDTTVTLPPAFDVPASRRWELSP